MINQKDAKNIAGNLFVKSFGAEKLIPIKEKLCVEHGVIDDLFHVWFGLITEKSNYPDEIFHVVTAPL